MLVSRTNEKNRTINSKQGTQSEEKMESDMDTPSLWDTSEGLFYRALAAGRNHQFLNMLFRRPSHLQDLGSYKSHLQNGHYAGLRDVALDDIRGTEGRQNDFDDRFHPLTDRIRQRWQSIARAYSAGKNLPPIELIQVGSDYFVRDGHHRISVARALGYTMILATVTVL